MLTRLLLAGLLLIADPPVGSAETAISEARADGAHPAQALSLCTLSQEGDRDGFPQALVEWRSAGELSARKAPSFCSFRLGGSACVLYGWPEPRAPPLLS